MNLTFKHAGKWVLMASVVACLSKGNLFADTISLSELLRGQLIELSDGEIIDAELRGSPEYFVFYHSASW